MGWIKRNLFFVVGGALALICLGGSGFYIFSSWSANAAASDKLNEIYGKLTELSQSPQHSGNDKGNSTDIAKNTDIAKDQEEQELRWMTNAAKLFTSIPAIPPGTPVDSASFAESLRQTIDSLRHEAESASVTLPPQCNFAFSAQRGLVRFAGSLDPLAVQLGEVKAISEVLFAASINSLDSIQRVRVSDDDTQGPADEYTDLQPETNDLAIITPYVVTFRSFTPELARVLSGFATAPYPFIVKSVIVQPASSSTPMPDLVNANSAPMATGAGNPESMFNPDGTVKLTARARWMSMHPGEPLPQPGMAPPPAAAATAANSAGVPSAKGGLQTVLKEQLLTIRLEVDIVKLVPKS